jgi:peptidoglycan hydrolase CwlO-like protein
MKKCCVHHAVSAHRQLERMKNDLSDVASRERHLADTAQRISSELAGSRSASTAAAAELKDLRSQVNAMQSAIQSKDVQLEELKSALKQGGEV